MKRSRAPRLDVDGAAALALQGLAFLAADAERLGRFLALTGIGPVELRAAAGEAAGQAAVLDYLLQDESLLLVFAAEQGIAPEQVTLAHHLLSGPGSDAY